MQKSLKPPVKSCSDRIKEGLKLRNMTQTELSKKTGISKASISHYYNGKFEPKQTAIYLISKALDVDEVWLMGYDVDIRRIPDHERGKDRSLSTMFYLDIEPILKNLDMMNSDGIQKVIDYSNDILLNDKYRK